MTGRGGKFISPADVVRKQDGRIDLFNTILARKDPEAQIPTLPLSASVPLSNISNVEASPESNMLPTNSSVQPDSSSQENDVKRAKNVTGNKTAPVHKPKAVPSTQHPSGSTGSIVTLFRRYANDPSKVPLEHRYWHDAKHVIIKDGFPKAKVHMLVIPRVKIDKLTDLARNAGLNVLLELQERANWLIERLRTATTDMPFLEYKMGFHIVPSLVQLHLHVISQDFCAVSLKNKKHWNSFTTPFFVELSTAIEKIKRDKNLAVTSRQHELFRDDLKTPLKCNQCEYLADTFAKLKRHLEQHFNTKAEAWRKSQE